ncbi:MAG: class I SAM-dependent methyltransferase [Chloroflexi bacterium]|nr:class I SAM-dependent methyltransferase [Chloroflexota bacterium]
MKRGFRPRLSHGTVAVATAPKVKGHPWFAATYDLVTWWAERTLLRQLRSRVVSQATGTVLELGAGTGANFPYYPAAERIIATEPDLFMLRRAKKQAQALGLDVDLHQGLAEALPFSEASCDTVVSTLVLCTVAVPDRALAETKRVLKPGGAFRFIEHVRADGWTGMVQDKLTPAWRWFGAGCHLNRRTAAAIEAAGFQIVELEQRRLGPTPLLIGVAQPT